MRGRDKLEKEMNGHNLRSRRKPGEGSIAERKLMSIVGDVWDYNKASQLMQW